MCDWDAGCAAAPSSHRCEVGVSTCVQELMDHAPHVPFEEIDSVFVEEYGKGSAELFKEFEKEPLAAASLAQVHKATTHDGTTVAVKVEYPGLWQMMASDFGVFHTMAGQIKPGCARPLLRPAHAPSMG
jgi:predicted unusual protein kinase regulating ubiquinone biosynthesis (AarF/ABC1/UbiB family)